MVTPADHGSLLVVALATCMIVSQFYFPPHVETRWRARLRRLFYLGAAAVAVLALRQVYEVYKIVGL